MVKSLYGLSLLTVLTVLALSACASKDTSIIAGAVTAPLNDLNIVREKIPDALLAVKSQPYAAPGNVGCVALMGQVKALDEALGADFDAPTRDDKSDILDKGVQEAKKAAVKDLRDTTENLLPYRNWIRKLSGADRYSKKVSAAVVAGTARRAFLRGWMAAKGCSVQKTAAAEANVKP